MPGKARVDAFTCLERYGMLWVALEEPRYALPEIPEFDDARLDRRPRRPVRVERGRLAPARELHRLRPLPVGASRACWATRSGRSCPTTRVRTEGHVLHYDVVRPEAPNSDDFPVFANETAVAPERRSRYQLHLPYTILLRLGWGGEKGMVYFFSSQPVDADHCTGYVTIARNYDREQPDSVLQDFEDTIFNQDRRVVESQRPERVPFDLAAEMHLKFDAVAIEYRKAMRGRRAGEAPARALIARARWVGPRA